MLRAYFDGDGTVGSEGEVIAATASKALASDLSYALKRFGIHARLRVQWKRATNSSHAGALYHYVCISVSTTSNDSPTSWASSTRKKPRAFGPR